MKAAGIAVLGALTLVACKGRKEEPRGLGPYMFGSMVKKNVKNGICEPDKLDDGRPITWCFGMPAIKIGKSKRLAEVNTYFGGTEDDAPLIELQLQVRGCIESEADEWMRERFGAPYQTKGSTEYWKNSFLWAAAFLPKEPGRCLLRFLPLSETAQIEKIKLQ